MQIWPADGINEIFLLLASRPTSIRVEATQRYAGIAINALLKSGTVEAAKEYVRRYGVYIFKAGVGAGSC